jgi:hypothetical protein
MNKKEPGKVKGLNSLLSILAERARIKKHNKLFAGCLKTEAMLDYLHGRLTSEEAGVVKNHLRKCPRCAEELKLIKESEGIVSEQDL